MSDWKDVDDGWTDISGGLEDVKHPNAETAADIASRYSDKSFGTRVASGAAAIPETIMQLISGTPGFVTGTAGKLYSLAQGKISDKELEQASHNATPQLFRDITYEPRTDVGKLMSMGLSEGFTQAGRNLGNVGAGLRASTEAILEGTGQTGAQKKFEQYRDQLAPVTQTLMEAGMVGSMSKPIIDRFTKVDPKLEKAKAESDSYREQEKTAGKFTDGFEYNPETKRYEKGNLYVDPITGQIISSKSGKVYGWYDKPTPEQPVAPRQLPYYAGEPLITFPDGTTMTRAQFEIQKRLTEDRTGVGPTPPVMSPKDIALQDQFGAMEVAAREFPNRINEPAQQRPVGLQVPKQEVPPLPQEMVGRDVDASNIRSPYFTAEAWPTTIPGVERSTNLINPATGRQHGGMNFGNGRMEVDPQYLWGLWSRMSEEKRSKFQDFEEFYKFVQIHETKHNYIKGDLDPVKNIEIERRINTLSLEDIKSLRRFDEEIPVEAYANDIAHQREHTVDPVTGLNRFNPVDTSTTISPKQLRAERDKISRILDSVEERLAKVEEAASRSQDHGTVNTGKLDNYRKFLEERLADLDRAIEVGKKAGINFGGRGRTQRGSVDPSVFKEGFEKLFSKLKETTPTLKEFAKSIGRNIEDPVTKDLYEKYYGNEIKSNTNTNKALSKIPGLKEVVSPELIPLETMMERWATESDISSNAGTRAFADNLSSGGRMTALRTGNSFIDWNVENILGETRKANVETKRVQNEIKGEVKAITGSNSLLNKFSGKGEGERTFVETMLEMLRVEGTGEAPNIPAAGRKFQEKLSAALKDVGERVKEELASQGIHDFELRPNYLAGVFFGPYRSIVKDASGKVIGVVAGRTKNEASHAIDYLKEQMPEVTFDVVKYDSKFDGIDGSVGARYAKGSEVLELLKNQDEAAQQLQQTLSQYYAKVQENYMGYKHHFKEKKGVFGSEGNRSWDNAKNNAYDLLEAQLSVIDHANMWLAEQKLMKDIDKILADPNIKQESAKQYVLAYLDHAFGRSKDYLAAVDEIVFNIPAKVLGLSPSSLKEVSALARNTALVGTLGASLGFITTQFVQVPQALKVGITKARENGINGNWFGSSLLGGMDTTHAIAGRLDRMSTEGRFFLDYFKEHGTTDPHLVEHTIHRKIINTIGMNPIQKALYESLNITAKGADATTKLIGKYSIEKPEAMTRGTFAMAMAHYYRSAGYSLKEAAIQADKDTSTLFVDYSPQERAMMFQKMGELGKFASTVSSFKMNNLNQWVTFSNKGMYKTLAALALTSWATTGLFGLPGGDEAEFLASWAKSKGMDIQTPREYMMSSVPKFVAFGPLSQAAVPFGGPSMSLHRKFAQDNVIPDDAVSFLYPLLSFYTNKIEKTRDWVKSGFGKQEGAVLARELSPGNFKYAVDYSGLTNEKGLTVDPNTIHDVQPLRYGRSKNEWKLAAILGIVSQDEFRIKQIRQLDKISEQAWKESKKSKIQATISAFDNGDKTKFEKLYRESLQYAPEANEEIAKYINGRALSNNVPIEKLMEIQFARGTNTVHGIKRFQQFKQMQENK